MPILAIDLGTTNSVVAVMDGKEPRIIENEEGARTTPSVVAWDDKGEAMVGQVARRQAVTNPKRTVFSIKRFMGRKHAEVGDEIGKVPYEVVRAAAERAKAVLTAVLEEEPANALAKQQMVEVAFTEGQWTEAQRMLEELQNVPSGDIFATFNNITKDDPLGEARSSGMR